MNQLIGDCDLLYIQEQVEQILKYSQDYPFDLDATNLICQWREAKKPFISLFGDTMIRTKEKVKVQLTEEQQSRRFRDFMEALSDNDILTDELESFLYINKEGFFENKVILPFPSKNIQTGARISKSLRKFIADEETIRWTQDTASKFIQESKIEGYLYLSVDPRDFLTLSENNENWWSCHSLDGDYRAGNLSYMVDKTTIVAYLANNRKEHLKCLPEGMEWKSKKWRMLLHTDLEKVIYCNRNYPFYSEALETIAYKMLSNFIPGNFVSPSIFGLTKERELFLHNQLTIGGRVFDTIDIIDESNYLGYCDIIHSRLYSPRIAVKAKRILKMPLRYDSKQEEEEEFKDVFGIKIGEKPVCPDCGKGHLERHNSFLCTECIANRDADEDFYFACGSCGRRLYGENDIYYYKEECLCKACYKTAIKEEKEKT